MNHEEAIRDMAVERYLLGELPAEACERFEEHYFECALCAEDLRMAATLMDAVKLDAATPAAEQSSIPRQEARATAVPRPVPSRSVPGSAGRRFFSPWLLVPALAACLLVILYQSLVLLPGMRRRVALASTPAVLADLVLANADARGDAMPEIAAPTAGSLLLSVDVPSGADFASYRCSLYAPSGALVWQLPVSRSQVNDTVYIHLPAANVQSGVNVLLVEGVRNSGAPDANVATVARYRFRVTGPGPQPQSHMQ